MIDCTVRAYFSAFQYLPLNQIAEHSRLRDQGIVAPILHDLSVGNHKNTIAILHRGQAMRDDQRRLTRDGIFHGLLNQPLAHRVERAGRFIKDEEIRLG